MLALMLMGCTCSLAGCSNSDKARDELRRQSEDGYGVMRTVTAYSTTGMEIGSWSGKVDVQYVGSESSPERVDLVFFDGEEPVDRVVISGAIVIVENE